MKDAWEQLDNLLNKFTVRNEVRPDIEVVALGTERGVELVIWDKNPPVGSLTKRHYKSTGRRNVKTMRELAQALNDACDFVEKSNPEWASKGESVDEWLLKRSES